MAQTSMHISPPGLLQLPIELVIHTLRQLWPDELGAVAAVSRALYKAALLAGYYIPFTIEVQPGVSARPQLEKFREATRHARATGIGLDLRFACYFAIPGPVNAADEAIMRAEILDILHAVTTALPFLVNLDMQLPDIFDTDIVAALRHAAPRLRSLDILLLHSTGYKTNPLPSDLFGARAPNLREVALGNVTVFPIASPYPGPIVAFQNVTHLRTYVHDDQVPALSPHFPSLVDLYIGYSSAIEKQPAAGFDSILEGLRLNMLTVEDVERYEVLSRIARVTDIRTIPRVRHICAEETWATPSWQRERGKLCAHLTATNPRHEDVNILVVPEDRTWRYDSRPVDWTNLIDAFPLAGMPHLGTRLEYLRLHSLFVLCFVTASQGVTYDALRRLRVDLDSLDVDEILEDGDSPFGRVWPYSRGVLEDRGLLQEDLGIVQFASCPRLEKLTIVADGELKLARIRTAEVTLLARTLGRGDRSKDMRLSLALVRVEPDNPDVLEEWFSSVIFASAGVDSAEDDERGLWDEPFP